MAQEIAYATFIIAHLRNSEGIDTRSMIAFWTILGLAAIVALTIAFRLGQCVGFWLSGALSRRAFASQSINGSRADLYGVDGSISAMDFKLPTVARLEVGLDIPGKFFGLYPRPRIVG